MKRKSLFITLPIVLFLYSEANAQGVLIKDASSTNPTAASSRMQVDAATAGTPATTTLEGIQLTNGVVGGTNVTPTDGLLIGVGNYNVLSSLNAAANTSTTVANSYSILNREATALVLGTGNTTSRMVMKSDGRVAISHDGSFSTLSLAAYAGALSTSTQTNAKFSSVALTNARLTVKGTSVETALFSQAANGPAGHFFNNSSSASLIAQNVGTGGAASFINAGTTTVYVQNRNSPTGNSLANGVFYQSTPGLSVTNNIGFRSEIKGDNNYGYFANLSGAATSIPMSGQKGFSVAGTSYGNRNNTFVGDISNGGGGSTPVPPATGAAHVGIMGHVFPPNAGLSEAFAFGVYGDASQDGVSSGTMASAGTRIGGVLGRVYEGDVAGTKLFAYGILGYIESTGTPYGVYLMNEASAQDNGRVAAKKENQVGIGAFAGVSGALIKGGYYGINVKGNRFGIYSDGKTIVNDVMAQVTNTGREVLPTYVPTSTTVDVSSRGVAQLVNGSAFVAFDSKYTQLVEEGTIMVTVTPNAASAGVYVTEVTSKGFRVIENNGGASNIPFTWRAEAIKKGMTNVSLPAEVLDVNYDTNMRKVMISDMSSKQSEKKGMSVINGKLTFENVPVAPVVEDEQAREE